MSSLSLYGWKEEKIGEDSLKASPRELEYETESVTWLALRTPVPFSRETTLDYELSGNGETSWEQQKMCIPSDWRRLAEIWIKRLMHFENRS